MPSTNRVAAVLMFLGVFLLLNPLYFHPGTLDGDDLTRTYTTEKIDTESEAAAAIRDSPRTLVCDGERPCVVERAVARQGAVETGIDVDSLSDQRWDPYNREATYVLVVIDGEYYVPEVANENGTSVLTHRGVSVREALDRVAVPSDEMYPRSAVYEALETGSVQTLGRPIFEFERREPVEHDGEFYRVDGLRAKALDERGIVVGRALAFLGGLGLFSLAWEFRGRATTGT